MLEMTVSKTEAEKWGRWLKEDSIDFEEAGIDEDAVLYRASVMADDGTLARLEVCSGQNNIYVQMIWDDHDTNEMASCTGDDDEIEGEWTCGYDSKYDVMVVAK